MHVLKQASVKHHQLLGQIWLMVCFCLGQWAENDFYFFEGLFNTKQNNNTHTRICDRELNSCFYLNITSFWTLNFLFSTIFLRGQFLQTFYVYWKAASLLLCHLNLLYPCWLLLSLFFQFARVMLKLLLLRIWIFMLVVLIKLCSTYFEMMLLDAYKFHINIFSWWIAYFHY